MGSVTSRKSGALKSICVYVYTSNQFELVTKKYIYTLSLKKVCLGF